MRSEALRLSGLGFGSGFIGFKVGLCQFRLPYVLSFPCEKVAVRQ